jgi:protein-S-isoprenylcysteine O-methyltransferase Ste14
MRSKTRHSTEPCSQSRWRQFADFVVRRRARILLTIFIALFVDYWGGSLLQHNLADVHQPKTLFGLALIFAGCTLLAWSAGSKHDQFISTGNKRYSFIKELRFIGLLVSMPGLCLLIDDPKSICLLLGPVILLDLIRLRREDYERFDSQRICPHPAPAAWFSWPRITQSKVVPGIRRIAASIMGRARPILRVNGTRRADWPLRLRIYVPAMIVPVVTLAVIRYAWPFNSLEFHETWEIRCLFLSFIGLAIRMFAAAQMPDRPAARKDSRATATLITDGIFSVVRYPRYVGDFLIGLGAVLIPFVWWLAGIYSLAFYAYYKRIIRLEDEGLRRQFGSRFDQWASVTPALIPRISRWRPASSPISWRTALKREHTGLVVVIALHSSIEWLEHLILDKRVMLEIFWIVVALTGLTAYILVRHLARHTRVLNVPAAP